MLKEGDPIPPFSLPDQEGKLHSSTEYAGKTLVIYFYPKDDTSGCTKEACSFRDAYADLRAAGAVVLGISADSSASHDKFARKYALPFTLLSDTEKTTIMAFGAWGQKSMYGKAYEGILRSTFIVGPDGIVKKVFPKVSPADHAAQVLAAL